MTKRNRKKEENIKDVNTFMHEVEEAMHIETMVNFWHASKIYIISTVVLSFVVVTSWQWYLMATENGLEKQADRLWEIERSNPTVESYDELIKNGSKGYKLLAKLKKANKLLEAGNTSKAISIYDDLLTTNKNEDFRELASFYKGLALLTSDKSQAEAIFKKIVAEEGTFIISAKEMLGIIAEDKGDYVKASKFYENIIVNPAVPQGLRNRVQSRLDYINKNSEKLKS